jgi:hypothetical protein
MDSFIQVVGVLVTLSVASERAVEVLKGYIPWLGQQRPGEPNDARRRSHIILASTAINLLVAYVSWDLIASTPVKDLGKWPAIIGLGLLSTGGSSMWNSVLSYLVGMKDIKKSEAAVAKSASMEAVARTASQPSRLVDDLSGMSLTGQLGGAAR